MDKDTITFDNSDKIKDKTMKLILQNVCDALEEKGYNPLDQLVGYILSGDPSYITGHNNARNLIRQIERDYLVEALLREYLDK